MKKIVAGLMAALTALVPVQAMAEEDTFEEHLKIIAVLDGLGIELSADDAYVCNTKKWKGAYNTNGSQLVVCNNSGTQEDRLETLRHEAWHVYQDLRDCSLQDTTGVPPVFLAGVVPEDIKAWVSNSYPAIEVPSEAEAFWAAEVFDADAIAKLLFFQAKSCGYKL